MEFRKKRCHRLLLNLFDKITDHNLSITVPILLTEAEMAWNCTRKYPWEISHLSIFVVLPQILSSGPEATIQQRVELMEVISVETDHIWTTQLLFCIFNAYENYDIYPRSFNANKLFRFHWLKKDGDKGFFTSIEPPPVNVKLGNPNYPTH